MLEIGKFTPGEIDAAIEGLDGLQGIIVPILQQENYENMADKDIQEFKRHIMLAKHALIAMGDYLEGKMTVQENKPLTLNQLQTMFGEPVWVCGIPGHEIKWTPGWRIVDICCVAFRWWNDTKLKLYFADYGRTWLAYARRPEVE